MKRVRRLHRSRLLALMLSLFVCLTAVATAAVYSPTASARYLADTDSIEISAKGFPPLLSTTITLENNGKVVALKADCDVAGSFTLEAKRPEGYTGLVHITIRGFLSKATAPATPSSPSVPSTPSSPPASAPAASPPASTPASPPVSSGTVSAGTSVLLSDVNGKHDAIPRGVPEGYDWREQSTKGGWDTSKWQGLNVWGQIFATESGGTNFNVRMEARNPQVFFLVGDTWQAATFTAGDMGGAYWRGDYQPSANTSAQSRQESAGTYSVPLSALQNSGTDTYHWWWDGMNPRIAIPSNAKGAVVSQEVRIVPEGGGSLAGANLIASISADLFATVNTIIADGGINPAIAQSRMKTVTGDFQTFYASNLSSDVLSANPPPIG